MGAGVLWEVTDNCIGCGSCARDCARNCLKMEKGKPVFDDELCNLCGHCFAVCPVSAIRIEGEDPSVYKECMPEDRAVDTHRFREMIRNRRSIRSFNRRLLEPYKIKNILEAGRYAPTACNAQNNRFVLIAEKRKDFQQILIRHLAGKGQEIIDRDEKDPVLLYRASLWLEMGKRIADDPENLEPLFMGAQAVLLIISNDLRDGSIAASYMQLMAEAEGIGTLMNGYISDAVNDCPAARELLQMKEEEEAVISILLGYPSVRYYRPAPRKSTNVVYL